MKRRSLGFVLLAAIALAKSGSTAAQSTSQAKSLVRLLEAKYRDVKTLKAHFLQTYRDGRSGIQVESGTVYFSRPGRMRWEYESPESKLFIADGKTVWFFIPADRTVTRSAMKESDDWRTPLALLTGKAKLSELCERISLASSPPDQAGVSVLECVPKGAPRGKSSPATDTGDPLSPSSYDRVLLEIDSTTGELADVRILQQGGVELEFRFGQWQQGLPFQNNMFHFQVPSNVAVVEGSSQ